MTFPSLSLFFPYPGRSRPISCRKLTRQVQVSVFRYYHRKTAHFFLLNAMTMLFLFAKIVIDPQSILFWRYIASIKKRTASIVTCCSDGCRPAFKKKKKKAPSYELYFFIFTGYFLQFLRLLQVELFFEVMSGKAPLIRAASLMSFRGVPLPSHEKIFF